MTPDHVDGRRDADVPQAGEGGVHSGAPPSPSPARGLLRLIGLLPRVVATALLVAGCLCLLALMLLIGLDVLGRNTGKTFWVGTDEWAGFLMIGIIFLPAADLMLRHEQIVVDLVTNLLGRRVRWVLRLLALILGIGFTAVALREAVEFREQQQAFNARSFTVLFPLDRVSLGMIVGLAALLLAQVAVLVRHLTRRRAPVDTETHHIELSV